MLKCEFWVNLFNKKKKEKRANYQKAVRRRWCV